MPFTGLPRVRLLEGPTPLQRLRRIEALTGHRGVYVKRDDAMALALGGNKLRSLEFWLGEAIARGSDVVLVAGKPESNQCRLTAATAAKCGLDCVVVHNADPPVEATGNLLLNRLFGADIHFVGPVDEAVREKHVLSIRDELAARGRRPYVVGDPAVGALGYVAGALELHQQAFEAEVALRHVVLPGSMGVTEAGFLFGCALLGGPCQVHLVTVEYPADELTARVERIFQDLAALTDTQPAADLESFMHVHGDYLGAGYEQSTPEALRAIRTFAEREALLLETTYTSKTFAGLLDLIAKGCLPIQEPICALHTGGLPALFQQTGTLARL